MSQNLGYALIRLKVSLLIPKKEAISVSDTLCNISGVVSRSTL